ncbi:murein biosynthesis integral membrane protein MurJ [Actinomyces ruminis]|uniref:murein biosynthesis integral membrane protein MurJ n=1 Tax=Actinomyces ruminis TaxID=1937003 RepID=UPI000B6D30C5|nr:lipid II flippase MurJ [Actinomyces ruminis]
MSSGAGARRAALGAAGGVAGLTLVSRALGFLRWIVQATTVGAGTVAGAYATANQVPNVLYEVVVGGALAATVVPLLAAPISAGRSHDVQRTASALLWLVLLVLTPLAIILAAGAGPIAGWFPVSQGVDPGLQRDLVAAFLRMFAAQVPLYGIGVVLTGVLQAHGRFTWPALTPVLSSLVVIATYAVYGTMTDGVETASPAALRVLGWGTTAGVAALSLPLLWPVYRLGVRLRPTLDLGRAEAAKALRLGGAGVWTLLAQQISVLAVLALARAGGNTGTVAVYQYTQAVYVLPYAVLVVPVATVIYPRLAAAFTRSDGDAHALTARSTALVTGVAVAGAGMLLAAADGAERFFALLADVGGMGASLALLAPGLVATPSSISHPGAVRRRQGPGGRLRRGRRLAHGRPGILGGGAAAGSARRRRRGHPQGAGPGHDRGHVCGRRRSAGGAGVPHGGARTGTDGAGAGGGAARRRRGRERVQLAQPSTRNRRRRGSRGAGWCCVHRRGDRGGHVRGRPRTARCPAPPGASRNRYSGRRWSA